MSTMTQQGGMPDNSNMRQDLRKLEALRIATQCTIEKWLAKDSKELTNILDAARDMYAMTYDFEAEMAAKYAIPRSFAFMMESLFGEYTIKNLFRVPDTSGHAE